MIRLCRVGTVVVAIFAADYFADTSTTALAATGEFLVWGYNGFPRLLSADGSALRTYGTDVIGFFEDDDHVVNTESIDGFGLSADGQEVYVFCNTLGHISNFAFDLDTGVYLGGRGINQSGYIGNPWEDDLLFNVAIAQPVTRSSSPFDNSDLFYIGRLPTIDNVGSPDIYPDIVNVVDTSTGDVVAQVEPPTPTAIHDIALGPGVNGPRSRLYLAADEGIYAYEEMLTYNPVTFEPESSFELVLSAPPVPGTKKYQTEVVMDVGPDGYLYTAFTDLIHQVAATQIDRYDSQTGEFVDSFPLGGFRVSQLGFGLEGDLYVLGFDTSAKLVRYDISTGKKLGEYTKGVYFYDDFIVVSDPVPEPGSLALLVIGGAILVWRRPRRGT